MASKNKGKNRPQDYKPKQKREIATAATWGGRKASSTFDLDLPSGNTVLVKRVDMPTLLASGAFPDTLMAIVSEKIGSATGQEDAPKAVDKDAMKDIMGSPEKLGELFAAVDRIIPLVVEQPKVLNHRREVATADVAADSKVKVTGATWETIPDAEREEDVVYTDMVDLEDKMHIFQFAVGGTRDVEEFREELASTVADVSAS